LEKFTLIIDFFLGSPSIYASIPSLFYCPMHFFTTF